ncbi:YybS family protein [Salsuginibacillus kocurii]|uniref:YybS family protein n=1 Tax=Salsuginibacillus kocurii TaxID=427078 RepID=UPI00035C66E8|nr:YybS family protein [Salsuginibacillus kocurii]
MKQTRALTEGAVMLALFMILVGMALFIPVIGTLVIWLLPLPFIVYTVRFGLKPAFIVWITAFFISFLLGGVLALPFTLLFASGGVVIGELIRREKEALMVLVGGSLTYIVGLIIVFVGSIVIFDIDPVQSMQEAMEQSIHSAESMLFSLGQEPGEQLEEFEEALALLQEMTPMILTLTGIGLALVSQGISHVVLRRLKESYQAFPPFRDWNMPKSFIWYYLAALIAVLIGVEEGTPSYTVLWNVFPLLEIAMTVQGLTVVFLFFHQRNGSRVIPFLILGSSIIIPFLLDLIRLLGIVDLGFELKKRMQTDQK